MENTENMENPEHETPDFYDLVEDALADLPEEIAALLDNILLTVEDWPSADETLVKEDPDGNLYGLYE
ncbi:MAG: hypothetical protein ACR2KW_11745, partial [Rubrobacter sp.]